MVAHKRKSRYDVASVICEIPHGIASVISNNFGVVERVLGLHDEFIKLAAPLETLGIVAVRLHMKKTTHIRVDLPFEWEET